MSRTILNINVNASFTHDTGDRYSYGISYDGVKIILSDGTEILFGIENVQNCCERWDYLHSHDNVQDFVGAEFLGLEEKNTWPEFIKDEYAENALKDSGWNEVGFQAIDIRTSKGLLQFVVYNEHNGYYSHAAILKVGDVIDQSML